MGPAQRGNKIRLRVNFQILSKGARPLRGSLSVYSRAFLLLRKGNHCDLLCLEPISKLPDAVDPL